MAWSPMLVSHLGRSIQSEPPSLNATAMGQLKIRWGPKMYAASNKSVVDIEKSDSKCFEVIEHLLGKTAGFTHRTAYPLA